MSHPYTSTSSQVSTLILQPHLTSSHSPNELFTSSQLSHVTSPQVSICWNLNPVSSSLPFFNSSLPLHPFLNSSLPLHPFLNSSLPLHLLLNSSLPLHLFLNSSLPLHLFLNSSLPLHLFLNSSLPLHLLLNSSLPLHLLLLTSRLLPIFTLPPPNSKKVTSPRLLEGLRLLIKLPIPAGERKAEARWGRWVEVGGVGGVGAARVSVLGRPQPSGAPLLIGSPLPRASDPPGPHACHLGQSLPAITTSARPLWWLRAVPTCPRPAPHTMKPAPPHSAPYAPTQSHIPLNPPHLVRPNTRPDHYTIVPLNPIPCHHHYHSIPVMPNHPRRVLLFLYE
ncbi:hypothetical protein Pmani_027119 [Petrolisthes manimaculis]|uniref:Uncharacterized protein n=1 Tax=Petrolisthes manimaculis TaxID=1843537 RepID=A0AAE1P2V5_9EUCA|nr:hypothetical protein Pmani_027119 [Petrolisthes manimaculis]